MRTKVVSVKKVNILYNKLLEYGERNPIVSRHVRFIWKTNASTLVPRRTIVNPCIVMLF